MNERARSAADDIDELVSLSFVARKAKWHRTRMWRRLKALDTERPGLLQNVSRGAKPRYLVGLRALQQAWPGLFTEDLVAISDRVSVIEERTDENTRAVQALATELGRTRKRLKELRVLDA